ncbi:COL6A [Mytilus edulis]|uniref:COL6A n=1 Tax=Mytilus edulis TaxID=6550 RepID=A0A8S3S6A7_MYTED|nr:COL6A [Mytilus edulis]
MCTKKKESRGVGLLMTVQTVAGNGDQMLWEKLYESTSSSSSESKHCVVAADVVFLLDINQSPSVKVIQQFIIKVMDKFSNVGPKGVQFGVLSPTKEDNFFLDEYSNVEGYKAAVRSINPQRNGTVVIATFMQDIKDEYFSGEHGGGRPCAEKFIFILADNKTSFQSNTTKIVSDFKESGVTIYGIRIGDVSKTILEKMSNFKFDIHDPEAVETFVKSVCISTLCRHTPEEEAQAILDLPIPKSEFLKLLKAGGRHQLSDSDPVHPFLRR